MRAVESIGSLISVLSVTLASSANGLTGGGMPEVPSIKF